MKKRILTALCFGISVLTAAVISLWGVFFSLSGQELGFIVLNYYMIFPVVALICGFVLALTDRRLSWIFLPLTGILGLVMPYPVFRTVDIVPVALAMAPAAAGILLGILVGKLHKIYRKRKTNA